MSSRDNLLLSDRGYDVDAAPVVVSAPAQRIDDSTRALLTSEHQRGVAEGRAAGLADGRRELEAAAAGLGQSVEAGFARLDAMLREQHEALAAALESRVLAAVRAVLGNEPVDGPGLVVALRSAIAGIESTTVEVSVPRAHEVLAREALAGVSGLSVRVDESLGAHDAVVTGDAVTVDLRRERLLEELAQVLAGGAPLGPLGEGDGDA
jgi:flagellar biosynthesis/type III secretory pathway protein FliH